MRKSLLTATLSLSVALVGSSPAAAAAATNSTTVMLTSSSVSAQDAEWILRAQLPDGAITTHGDRAHIQPYLANFAAKGLAVAARDTGDARYSAAAWRWLGWYAAHQNASGYVTDYDVSATGVETSTGSMDSTDAYAGTFLIAARATYRATQDKAKLTSLQRGIIAAVYAIESTQDADGLTWAKPGWRVKYLMDQAEAFAGLRSATELANALGNGALAARAKSDADRMAAGVASLWNPSTASYDWAKFSNGSRRSTDWTKLYPDAAQQPWAVAFGLVPASRASVLMSRFNLMQPKWDRPEAVATYDTGPAPVGYWAAIGSAFLRVGATDRARLAFDRIRAAAIRANRAWPYNTACAGQLLVLGHG